MDRVFVHPVPKRAAALAACHRQRFKSLEGIHRHVEKVTHGDTVALLVQRGEAR